MHVIDGLKEGLGEIWESMAEGAGDTCANGPPVR